MDGTILQRVWWQPAHRLLSHNPWILGLVSFTCILFLFQGYSLVGKFWEVEGVRRKDQEVWSTHLKIATQSIDHHPQFSHFCEGTRMSKSNNQGKSQPVPAAKWQRRSQKEKEKTGRGWISYLSWTCSSWQDEVIFLTLAKPDYFFKGMKKREM